MLESAASTPQGTSSSSSSATQQLLSPTISGCALYVLRNLGLAAVLGVALLLTYDRCIGCVVAIAAIAGVTMNCVPLMPAVFLVSVGVLVVHAIDYHSASIRVEVPLQDIMYIPTWDDVSKYVKVAPKA